MSVAAVTWVLEHSETTGTDRMVLLVMAEAADTDGWNVCLGPSAIAKRARIELRWAKRIVKRLQECGAITPGEVHKVYGTRVYSLSMTRGEVAPVVDTPPGSIVSDPRGRSVQTPVADRPLNPKAYPTPTRGGRARERDTHDFSHLDEAMA